MDGDSLGSSILTEAPEAPGWPPGFIEQTAGSIQDETFRRHDQGEFEKRLEF